MQNADPLEEELVQYPKLNALEDLNWVTAPRPGKSPSGERLAVSKSRSPGGRPKGSPGAKAAVPATKPSEDADVGAEEGGDHKAQAIKKWNGKRQRGPRFGRGRGGKGGKAKGKGKGKKGKNARKGSAKGGGAERGSQR